MQKIINLDLKNIKCHLTGGEKIIILSFASLIAGFFVFSLVFSNPTFASENITTNVLIEPSLTVTIPSAPLVLNLDPASKTYDSKSFPVSVATNNITGYKLSVSTTGDITDLTRDISSDTTTLPTYTIPTLDSGSSYAAPSDFPANKWGYKKDSGNYIPFSSPTPLLENTVATNGDTTTLSFGSKIDYTQPSGAYKTTLIFTATTNPMVNYMQDLNPALCATTPMTVVDKRDNEEYTIAKLADGNCWLLENLRLDISDPAVQAKLTSATTNASDETLNYLINGGGSSPYATAGVIAKTTTGGSWANSYNAPYIATANMNTVVTNYGYGSGKAGIYYNYCAASAGSYCISTTSGNASYDICPSGWRMPTGGDSGEYQGLYSAYSSSVADTLAALSVSLSGYIVNNTYYHLNEYNWSWSSTGYNGYYSYLLWATASSYNGSYRQYGRAFGNTVRCILDDPRTISDITTMQEMNPQIAAKMTNGDTATLKDSRDGQDYTIAKINGNVWMTRNLAIGCNGTGSTYGSDYSVKTLTSTDSNISVDYTTSTISLTAGNSNDSAYQTCSPTYGAWYNYYATTAGTINGSSIKATYDICPIGWRLPTRTEQTSITSYANAYAPISGGRYYNGSLGTNGGYWWSSDNSSADRYALYWVSSSLTTNTIYSTSGIYIRCIAK